MSLKELEPLKFGSSIIVVFLSNRPLIVELAPENLERLFVDFFGSKRVKNHFDIDDN